MILLISEVIPGGWCAGSTEVFTENQQDIGGIYLYGYFYSWEDAVTYYGSVVGDYKGVNVYHYGYPFVSCNLKDIYKQMYKASQEKVLVKGFELVDLDDTSRVWCFPTTPGTAPEEVTGKDWLWTDFRWEDLKVSSTAFKFPYEGGFVFVDFSDIHINYHTAQGVMLHVQGPVAYSTQQGFDSYVRQRPYVSLVDYIGSQVGTAGGILPFLRKSKNKGKVWPIQVCRVQENILKALESNGLVPEIYVNKRRCYTGVYKAGVTQLGQAQPGAHLSKGPTRPWYRLLTPPGAV